MSKHTPGPKGKQGRMDSRLHFVAQCLNKKITENANLANEWFINNKAHTLSTDEAIERFKGWLQ